MRKYLKVADFFTMANLAFGMLSIFHSILGEFTYAVIFLLLAVLFDYLDGKIARLMKQGFTDFGKQLDSLSDLISFGVGPAVFAYCLGLQSPVAIIILIFFVVCGLLRLARFNVTKMKHFEGVPITTSGYIVPLIYFLNVYFLNVSWNYLLPYYFIVGLLMISSIRIKKI